jgi:hypothetical protein
VPVKSVTIAACMPPASQVTIVAFTSVANRATTNASTDLLYPLQERACSRETSRQRMHSDSPRHR